MTKQIKNQSTNKHKINSRGFRKPTANNSMRSGQPQFNELVTLLGWIVSEFYSKIPGQEQCISYFLERLKNSFLSQGKKGFILTGKSWRALFLKWLSNHDKDDTRTKGLWRKVKSFLGRDLSVLLLKSMDPTLIRCILTGLTMTRSLKLPVTPDLRPIITPALGVVTDDYAQYIPGFWRRLGFRRGGHVPSKVRFERFHYSSKRGPNGHAMWGFLRDACALPESLLHSIEVLAGPDLGEKIRKLRVQPERFQGVFPVPDGHDKIRKVVGIPDKEGKTRVIAILDYFSQTSLKPFHEFLFGLLRKIPQDCTFDQGCFVEGISKWVNPVYYSVDLTAATDRFPIDVIVSVLEGRFPKDWVAAWRDIMVGYPFEVSNGDQKGSMVSYAVGNPMGAYSSWASFALSMHFIVYKLCQELNIEWTTAPYYILGDDVLIGDRLLGEAFRHELTLLGVEVSELKTYISSDMFEFCKRWFFKGVEVSPLSVSVLINTWRSYPLLVAALMGETHKGLIPVSGIRGSILGLLSRMKRRSKLRKRISQKASYVEALANLFQGKAPSSEVVSNIWSEEFRWPLKKYGLSLSSKTSDRVVKVAISELFMEAMEKGDKPLGELATNLVMLLTDPEKQFASDGLDLIYCIPILGYYGQLEEQYLKAQREIDSQLSLRVEDWPINLRQLPLAQDDSIFYSRTIKKEFIVSTAIANRIIEQGRFMRSKVPLLMDTPSGTIEINPSMRPAEVR